MTDKILIEKETLIQITEIIKEKAEDISDFIAETDVKIRELDYKRKDLLNLNQLIADQISQSIGKEFVEVSADDT